MSRYDRFRWLVLDIAACYHSVICAFRMTGAVPQTRWLHDRPDWFVKYVAISAPRSQSPVYIRLRQQAQIELDFRRATGVSK